MSASITEAEKTKVLAGFEENDSIDTAAANDKAIRLVLIGNQHPAVLHCERGDDGRARL